jgi:hypothetical protein
VARFTTSGPIPDLATNHTLLHDRYGLNVHSTPYAAGKATKGSARVAATEQPRTLDSSKLAPVPAPTLVPAPDLIQAWWRRVGASSSKQHLMNHNRRARKVLRGFPGADVLELSIAPLESSHASKTMPRAAHDLLAAPREREPRRSPSQLSTRFASPVLSINPEGSTWPRASGCHRGAGSGEGKVAARRVRSLTWTSH